MYGIHTLVIRLKIKFFILILKCHECKRDIYLCKVQKSPMVLEVGIPAGAGEKGGTLTGRAPGVLGAGGLWFLI